MPQINFQELLKDKKVKNVIVVSVALIAAILFLYIMFFKDSIKEQRNDKEVMVGDEASRLNFGVPNTQDNNLDNINKMDAFEQKLQDSLNYVKKANEALSMSSSANQKQIETEGFSDADFDRMRKTSLSNSHSTYGNSSMWSNDIPSGSNVGYSDLGTVVQRPSKQPKKQKQPISYNDDDNANYEPPTFADAKTPTTTINQTNTNQPPINLKQIKAKLISTGYATTGRSLSFVLLEPFNIGKDEVKKGQVITGTSIITDNRMLVKFSSIKLHGNNIPTNAYVVGYDGDQGLPIRGTSNSSSDLENAAKDEASSVVSSIPFVGGIISRATSGTRNRSTDNNKIQLSGNVECKIVFNN